MRRTAILVLRLLGGCQGSLAPGEALRLPTRKAWALLAYLAVHPGREIGREQLAGLLWGERPEEQARASLRQTLYELRSALGDAADDRLLATRETVSWLGDGVDVDALRLEKLAQCGTIENLAEAASLYRGAFLDGLETGETGFDDWLAAERARLHDLACGALERLALAHLEHGDTTAAIETARQLLRFDPLREDALRLLMRGLAAEGRRNEALKQFCDLESLLRAELGVAPDSETLRLRERLLRNGDVNDKARPADRGKAAPSPEPPPSRPSTAAPARGVWRTVATLVLALAVFWFFFPGGLERAAEILPMWEQSSVVYDKPSIAVLPFANLSGNPERNYLADGLTEDLITALSKTSQLLVIARTSVAGYKDNPVDVQSIARDLDVRYVLEGSVQRSGDDLRITAQLIDARTGHHLWGERFDRKASDLFAMQDDIVRRVLIELQVKLTDGEHARVASRGTINLDAWLMRLRAMDEVYKFTRESTIRARERFWKAHELDPEWGRPLAGIAWSYWWEARKGWADDRDDRIREGIAYAQRAIEMNPNDPLGYMQLGNLLQLQGDNERGVALRQKAVEIAPNDFQANWGLGTLLYRAGKPDRGVEVLKHALKLCPRPPASLLWSLSHGQLFAGQYEDAIETARRVVELTPDNDLPYTQMAAAYSALGRLEEARAAAAEVLRIKPAFTVSDLRRDHEDYKDRATVESLAGYLLDAGLPE